MSKHSSLLVTLDGVPLAGQREAEQARLVKAFAMLAGRIGYARRGADGSLVAVPDDEVELDVAQLQLQNMAAPPDTVRGLIASLASAVRGREAEVRP